MGFFVSDLPASASDKIEEGIGTKEIFNSISLGLAAFIAILLFGLAFVFIKKAALALVAVALILLLVGSRGIVRLYGVRSASICLMTGLWVIITINIWLAGGVNSVIAGFYIASIVMSAVLLGLRSAYLVCGISVVACLAMTISSDLGHGAPRYYPIPPWAAFIAQMFWVILVLPPITIALNGLRNGLAMARKEIAQRKQAEEVLRDREALFRAIFEQAAVGVAQIDSLDGRFVRINQRYCDIVGYTVQEMEQLTFQKITHPDDLEADLANMELLLAGKVREFSMEKRYIHKEGFLVWVNLTVSPMWEVGEAPHFHIAVVEDITERKRAENELDRTRNTLAEAQKIAHLGSFEYVVATQTTVWSEEEHRIYGLDPTGPSPTYEMMLQTFIHTDDAALLHEAFTKAMQTCSIYELEHRIVRPDGSVRWVYDRALPYLDDLGELVRYVGTTLDTTERKQAEEALTRSEHLYRTLFEGAQDAILIIDMEGDAIGQIVSANSTAAKIHGYTLEEMVTLNMADLNTSESARRIPERMKVILAGEWLREEASHRRKDGSVFPVEIAASLLTIDDHKYCLAIDRDITERKQAEEQLQESEETFRAIVEGAPDALFVQTGGLFAYVNNQALQLFGAESEEQLLGKPVMDRFHPRFHEIVGERIRLLNVDKKKAPALEQVYLRMDGSEIHVEVSAVPIRFINQDGALVFARDITERKQAESALIKSEERYKTVADFNYDWEYWIDSDEKFVYVSPSCERITGYSAQQFMDEPSLIEKIIHPDDLTAVLTHFDVARNVDYDQRHVLDFRIIRKDGETRWIAHACQPVYNRDGLPLGRRASNRDITDRKLAEEALRESEQRYRAVVDNLHVGISVINRNMEIVAINPFFGAYYPDVHPGTDQTCYSTYNDPPSSSPCSYCPCVLTFQDGEVHECETETPAGDKIRNYRIVSCPVKDEQDEVQLVVELVEDVTERRSLYAQLAQAQKMEAVGTLAGGVAHDFNNVLQVAMGYSEILIGDTEVPQHCRIDLQKINESARRGADLVQRLLTFSRKAEINLQPLDLNSRITDLQKMLERTLPKMVGIDLHLDGKLAKISADKTQIDQILMNLAVNARDAMPEGGKLIFETTNVTLDEEYVRSHLEAKPGPHVLLTVTDTGSGMDKGTLEHIFEPFYTTKGVGEGTGLGLAMVHGIVKHHGGHIKCYSEPGKGTTFKLYFPALISEEKEEETAERPIPKGGSETILLVDDEELIRDLGSRILTKAGYTLITASNGKEALEIYQKRRGEISLVLLDLMMPEMGGKQCLEGLLSLNPSVKVIVASGFSANGPTKDALSAGAKAFVNKPYDMRQVLEVVRQVLDAE